MTDANLTFDDLSAVPLFPLPNVVLFPRAVLPLHIFEERYLQMTADALRGHRQIAMALLKPGWEKDYHNRPEIEPIVCVGTILTHELLPDGKYNFLLQGLARARVVRERRDRAYRVAELELLKQTNDCLEELEGYRARLIQIFDSGLLLATGIGRQFRQLLGSPLPTADIADLIAFNFLEDVALKQALLADADVCRRVATIVLAFEAIRPAIASKPPGRERPSMN